MKVDINQCADDGKGGSDNNVFADSDKCKAATTVSCFSNYWSIILYAFVQILLEMCSFSWQRLQAWILQLRLSRWLLLPSRASCRSGWPRALLLQRHWSRKGVWQKSSCKLDFFGSISLDCTPIQGDVNVYDASFDCVKCAPGCDTCEDDSPCIYPINWILRSVLLGVNSIFMLIACGWFGFVAVFRTYRVCLVWSSQNVR